VAGDQARAALIRHGRAYGVIRNGDMIGLRDIIGVDSLTVGARVTRQSEQRYRRAAAEAGFHNFSDWVRDVLDKASEQNAEI